MFNSMLLQRQTERDTDLAVRFRKPISKYAALEARPQPVTIEAPTIESTSISILRGLKPRYEVCLFSRLGRSSLMTEIVRIGSPWD
jgi:hypothetical protein